MGLTEFVGLFLFSCTSTLGPLSPWIWKAITAGLYPDTKF